MPARTGNRRAALTLVVLTPLIAEITLGSTPLMMIWLLVLYMPVYGAGVLLIRELVCRASGGWGSILLLGLAYGLVEEGIALQSLTSPTLYGAAPRAPRVLGINTAYAELNLVYHAVFSVLIPIALVELLFARHGRTPYLSRGGLVVSTVVALLGVTLVRLSIPPTVDPGYPGITRCAARVWCPGRGAGGCRFAGAATPGSSEQVRGPATAGSPPPPAGVGMACGAGALIFLGLLFPFGGAHQPAFTHGNWVLVSMLAAAGVAVATGLALRRWTTMRAGSNQHKLAGITGALVGHTAFGLGAHTHTPLDTVGLALIGVVMVMALAALVHHLGGGTAA